MASVIKLSKGLDMNLKGKAVKEKTNIVRGSELALTPDAFVGMTPKVVVCQQTVSRCEVCLTR